MKTTDKYIFFWGGIYSQWYRSIFVVDGIEYQCAEQYMMAEKARTFSGEWDIKKGKIESLEIEVKEWE